MKRHETIFELSKYFREKHYKDLLFAVLKNKPLKLDLKKMYDEIPDLTTEILKDPSILSESIETIDLPPHGIKKVSPKLLLRVLLKGK
jgi:hypothetical protein